VCVFMCLANQRAGICRYDILVVLAVSSPVTHWEPFAELKQTGCVGDDRAVTNGTGESPPLLFLMGIPFFPCGHGKDRHRPSLPGKLGWDLCGTFLGERGVKSGGSGVVGVSRQPNSDSAAGALWISPTTWLARR